MYIQNEYLILEDRDIWNPKKITGTIMGEMLGLNNFKKKGDAVLTMIRAYKEVIDPFYTNRGAQAENILHELLIQKGFDIKWWDAKAVNYDNFAKSNSDFGGLIDAVIKAPTHQIVECKSKNLSKLEETKKFKNLSYECQARLYGYLTKCDDINLIYVFFTDEQEEKIKNGETLPTDPSLYKFYGYKVHLDREQFAQDMQKCMEYKNKCLTEKRIPLQDISNSVLAKLNLRNV